MIAAVTELKTILLVEDDNSTLFIESNLVEKMGYKLISAPSGEKAVEIVISGEKIDLVLLDIYLGPGIDGIETARRILENRKLPLIFFTSHSEQEIVEKVRGIQCHGYITKNSGYFVLKSAIEKALELFETNSENEKNLNALRELNSRQEDLLQAIDNSGAHIFTKDAGCRYSYANRLIREMFGRPLKDIIGRTDADFFSAGTVSEIYNNDRLVLEGKRIEGEEVLISKSEGKPRTFLTAKIPLFSPDGSVRGLCGISTDITERKLEEEHKQLTNDVLNLLNGSTDIDRMISDILAILKNFSGVEAVGIRLREGEDFPYYQTCGFPERFVKLENYLCARDEDGNILFDCAGRAIQECMCGNILGGSFDSSKPFFTDFGSFWTNSTSELQGLTDVQDRRTRIRNRCNKEGYESVALIPLRMGEDIIGLLQFNDRRRGMFAVETIRHFEKLGASVAISLSYKQTERKLKLSESRFSSILNTVMNGFFIIDLNYNIIETNEAFCQMSGYTRDELLRLNLADVEYNETAEQTVSHAEKVIRTGFDRFETRHKKKDGSVYDAEISVTYEPKSRQLLTFVKDITERKLAEKKLASNNSILKILHDTSKLLLKDLEWRNNIEKILMWLGRSTGACRAYLFELFCDRNGVWLANQLYDWSAEGMPYASNNNHSQSFSFDQYQFGGSFDDILKGAVLSMKVSELPGEMKTVFEVRGSGSFIIVPIVVEGATWGFMKFDDGIAERRREETEIDLIKSVASLIGMAILHEQGKIKLLNNEKKYLQLVENSFEGYWMLNKNNIITYANPKISEITGFSVEELSGRSPEDLMDSINLKIFLQHLHSVRKHGRKTDNIELISKDGFKRYVEISSTRIDSEGIYDGLYSLITDHTRYHELEEQIKLTKQEIKEKFSFHNIVGKSDHMKKIFSILETAANSDCNILIEGPSGTGKSIMARAIHEQSARAGGPFIVVNCSALPEHLLESELFGYVKGAFTDARANKPGKFAAASGGTIFLDEIAEMPVHLQAKFLTVIEERTFEPLGSNDQVKADIRIIAATNCEIEKLIREGGFRTDLYHRLKVVHINILPLVKRNEDIEVLIGEFIENLNLKYNKTIKGVSRRLYQFLMRYDFPGNVRELLNMFEYAYMFCDGDEIDIETLSSDYQAKIENFNQPSVNKIDQSVKKTRKDKKNSGGLDIGLAAGGDELNRAAGDEPGRMTFKKDLSRTAVIDTLTRHGGSRAKASAALGISRVQLWRKMKEYNLI